MDRSATITLAATLALSAMLPVSAAVVHKWVDADGVTHYSDELPSAAQTAVTRIELPESPPVKGNSSSGEHSIANQWRRMLQERIEREKLALERARLKAQQEPTTEIVYVEQPRESWYYLSYPGKRYRKSRHGHYRSHYKHGRPARHSSKNRQRKHRGTRRSGSLGYYKHIQ